MVINSFDAQGGWDTYEVVPAPIVTVFHDAKHRSNVSVPFVGRE
jgi:hypothetical protein